METETAQRGLFAHCRSNVNPEKPLSRFEVLRYGIKAR